MISFRRVFSFIKRETFTQIQYLVCSVLHIVQCVLHAVPFFQLLHKCKFTNPLWKQKAVLMWIEESSACTSAIQRSSEACTVTPVEHLCFIFGERTLPKYLKRFLHIYKLNRFMYFYYQDYMLNNIGQNVFF